MAQRRTAAGSLPKMQTRRRRHAHDHLRPYIWLLFGVLASLGDLMIEHVAILLPYVMSAVTLTAIYFAGDKRPWAWLLSLGNQAIWGLWIYLTWPQASGLVPMTCCLTVMYARNWRKWREP
jgi:hypothetical protein